MKPLPQPSRPSSDSFRRMPLISKLSLSLLMLSFTMMPFPIAGSATPAASSMQAQNSDLGITVIHSSESVVSGSKLLYLIRIFNGGPDTATDVVVNNSIPVGSTFSSITITQGTCQTPPVNGTGDIICSPGSIAPLNRVDIFLVVNVTAQSGSVLTNTATIASSSNDPFENNNESTEETFVIDADDINTEPFIANLSAPDSTASGTRLTYTITAGNRGPDEAFGLGVFLALPANTTFASLLPEDEDLNFTPPVGGTGGAIFRLSPISAGSSETFTLTVNVIAAAGLNLLETVEIIPFDSNISCRCCDRFCFPTPLPLIQDDNPNNNLASETTSISGGGIVELSWEQLPSTVANPTPPPFNVQVNPGNLAADQISLSDAVRAFGPAAVLDTPPCTLVQVNIYKSDQPNVQTVPENLWKVTPPLLLKTVMASAPSGSFYALTNVYDCSGEKIESARSNESLVPAGPTVGKVKIKNNKKLIVKGNGFARGVQIFIDGVGFSSPANVRTDGKVVQKGNLSDGRSFAEAAPSNKTVLISLRYPDGGISSRAFTNP